MMSWVVYISKNMVKLSKTETKTGGKNMILGI